MLARAARDERIGLCGSTLLYYDAPDTIQSLGGVFHPLLGGGINLGAGQPLRQLPSTEIVEAKLDYVVGASMLTSRRFLEDVGPMEESYFLYFEELNWSRRARRSFKQAWARDSLVYHKEGASIGTSSRTRSSDLSLYCYNLNLLRFLQSFHRGLLPVGVAVVVSKFFISALNRDRAAMHVIERVIGDFLWSSRSTRDGVKRLKAYACADRADTGTSFAKAQSYAPSEFAATESKWGRLPIRSDRGCSAPALGRHRVAAQIFARQT